MVSSPIVVHSAKRLMSFKLIPVFFKHCNTQPLQVVICKTAIAVRIDQGLEDEFLPTQLRKILSKPVDVHFHKGYDHSYYFIASFIGEHIAYHAAFLK